MKSFEDATVQYFANPNSTHQLGKKANEVIENSTQSILDMLKKNTNIEENMEIIYTSSSSESNNLAIKGLARSYRENGKHIISTFLEHSSVSSPLTYLKEQGYEIDIVDINSDGKVDIEQFKSLIREDTVLVSISYVDSELGTIQPIQEISNIISKYQNCFLHVDCTQAIGKIPVNLNGVDLISFAPHKFYGLNGSGALIKRSDIVLEPLINGGNSTTIYRSGTPVIGQIVAMEKALELAFDNLYERLEYVTKLNNLVKDDFKNYSKIHINSFLGNPFILNISIDGVKAIDFKQKLEEKNVYVSIKSACTTTLTPSRPVLAVYKDKKLALSSWRMSFSHLIEEEEIKEFLNIFKESYKYFIGEE
ncbi:Cysteine desulfurase [compost metagenome]